MRVTLLLLISQLLILHLVYGFATSSRSCSRDVTTTTTVSFRPRRTFPTSTRSRSGVVISSPPTRTSQRHYFPQPQRESIARRLSASVAPGGNTSETKKCPFTASMRVVTSLWGVLGVVYILAKAIIRVVPIALEPFQNGAVPLKQWQLAYVWGTSLR
jgi:hypothetical protein